MSTNLKKEKGIALVEVIISMTLFVTLATIAAGAIISLLGSNRQARAHQLVANNISFILEDLTKNMRVGTTYHCGLGNYHIAQDCLSGTNRSEIAYEPEYGDPEDLADQVVYRFQNESIEKSTDGGNTFITLSSPDVIIEEFQVYVHGAEREDDGLQPRALIAMRGVVRLPNNQSQEFAVQTSVTQRVLDQDID